MKTAFFDCRQGISGNRIIAALLDAGYPYQDLIQTIRQLLPNETFELDYRKISFDSQQVTFFDVILPEYDPDLSYDQRPKRSLSDIIALIEKSELHDRIKKPSIEIFQRLALAEADAHQCDIEEIDFHERGAIDTIIDIVGSMAGLHYFNVDKVISSPLNVGFGTISYRYGTLPIPAPATQRLLKHVPTFTNQFGGERVTPTGAAILTTICNEYSNDMNIPDAIAGYGLGKIDQGLNECLIIAVEK
jgi:hypothetical protein